MHTNNYQVPKNYFAPALTLVVNNQASKYAPLQNLALKAPISYQVASVSSVKRSLITLIVLLHILVVASIAQYYQQNSEASGDITPMIVNLISEAKNNMVVASQPLTKKPVNAPTKLRSNSEDKSYVLANQVSEAEQKQSEPALEKPINTPTESVKISEQKSLNEPAFEPPRFNADYLHNPTPEYPGMSRRRGEQGRVTLKVVVSSNGEPESVQLDKSSGFELLDKAALNAVKNWKFVPAKSNHQSVMGTVIVPVKFSLDS